MELQKDATEALALVEKSPISWKVFFGTIVLSVG